MKEFKGKHIFSREIERAIKKEVKPLCDAGRPGWNWRHTLATVYWMKRLLRRESGNSRTLIPVMYFHDTGYAGLITKKYSIKDVTDVKKLHAKKSEAYARSFLRQCEGFTTQEIDCIGHLIRIHDDIPRIVREEPLVFEADSLGQADYARSPPSLSPDEGRRWLMMFERNRLPLFYTKTGKDAIQKIWPKTKRVYQKRI